MLVLRKIILHVEDDAMVGSIVAKILTDAGYRVVTVHSAEDGLRKIPHVRPDLIITDLRMPGMCGLTLLRQLTTADGKTKIPVVVFTAFANMADDTVRALAAAVLIKPADVKKLAATVSALIGPPAQPEQAGPGKTAPPPEPSTQQVSPQQPKENQ